MNKPPVVFLSVALCGCVDLSHIHMDNKLMTANFNASLSETKNSLYSAALRQHLSMEQGDTLPGGMQRFTLQDANYEDVASGDISKFGNSQTESSVNFYYQPHDLAVSQAISAIISQCKDAL